MTNPKGPRAPFRSILGVLESVDQDPAEFALRILSKAAELPNGCWSIPTNHTSKGYSVARVFAKRIPIYRAGSHRALYEILHGKIPSHLVVDHKCRNRACCNPQHLRVVTQAVNATENSASLQAMNKAKTHCEYGHPLTGENVRRYKRHPGVRWCIACQRRRGLARYYREKALAPFQGKEK